MKYILKEDGIQIVHGEFVELDETILQKDMYEFYIVNRDSLVDELICWISEADKDRLLMKQDLKMLMLLDDEYILSSNSTNAYVHKDSHDFNEKCEELIEINKTIK